jgi:hypothetical protein
MGCRYCDLKGIYNNHVYYPTTPPSSRVNETYYNPSNLPKRTHEDYITRIEQIITIPRSKTRDILASNLGKFINNKLIYIFSLQD